MFHVSLQNRYFIQGTVALASPLHVGTGLGDAVTDSAVARTPDGLPFVPGSSFKGVLRSTVERLAPALGYATCALTEGTNLACPSANTDARRAYEKLRKERATTEADLVASLALTLCHTCLLFGSPFAASRLRVEDLRLTSPKAPAHARSIRDGVGIDRDTGAAREKIKYDFEIVPADATFSLHMLLENAEAADLALLSLGLAEFGRERGLRLGGLTSRGLGWGRLKDVKISWIDFQQSDTPAVVAHLVSGAWPQTLGGDAFVKMHLLCCAKEVRC